MDVLAYLESPVFRWTLLFANSVGFVIYMRIFWLVVVRGMNVDPLNQPSTPWVMRGYVHENIHKSAFFVMALNPFFW